MKSIVIPIDESLFLKDYATFEKNLLPVINAQRKESGFSSFSHEEAMNYYLDLISKFRDAKNTGPAR
jgi:hypothetical protein